MPLQLPPHYFIILLLPLPFSSGLIAKPGCPERCGDLFIPFPFGIGSDCSMSVPFNIRCNNSINPPRASFLSDLEIVELNSTQIRVKYLNLALSSYGPLGRIYSVIHNLNPSPFTFSDANWVTAIGCDDVLAVTGTANRSFSGGCVAFCLNRNDSGGIASCPNDRNGFGLGTGCCQTPIPKGTTNLYINLTDMHRTWERESKLFNTSYAFVGEKAISDQSIFSYRLQDLDNSTIFFSDNWSAKNTPPVVFDWRIGNDNCEQARQNPITFACRENSVCIDFDANFGGYLCNCSEGFKGNPYLAHGCQDINECANGESYPCDSNADCSNTNGSFECSCRRGYHGDGRLNGSGCNSLPRSVISNVLIGLGSGLGFVLLLFACSWLCKVLQKRKKSKRKEELFRHLLSQHQTNEGALGNTKLFPAKELEKATDHFNESRILGRGGQGTVYKGMLSDGRIVAIKKLKAVDENQLEQFINEVVIVSQINHRNVVKLLGCCLATDIPLLVYEFVPNGTLSDLIHVPNSEFPLSWSRRLKMATDIAGALAYLHSASSVPIFHRDIKPSNILLDEKYVVKVSDFGTSRAVALEKTHLTTKVKGTFGYLDPEYFQTGQFTDRSDVYSFGVVLVEFLTGQRPIAMESMDEERNLAARFLASMRANNLDAILDSQVYEQDRREEVMTVARLAQRCLNSKGKMRPSMKEVATELESLRMSEVSSTLNHGLEEVGVYEAKPLMVPDIEYTWSSNVASSSSDTVYSILIEKPS